MFTAIRELRLVEVPLPTIEQPNEVLLKVKSVGVCGSDLHGYTGQSGRRTPPLIMGHEVTAQVAAVGEALKVCPQATGWQCSRFAFVDSAPNVWPDNVTSALAAS
jgi:threonine dehydrogenase-like Zn-dependent dehydrogenase